MANIKIIGNITNINNITRYKAEDINLIGSQNIQEFFEPNVDYIEYYIYDGGNNLLRFNYNYNKYKLPSDSSINPSSVPYPNPENKIQYSSELLNSETNSTGSSFSYIEIDPIKDIQEAGYSAGDYKVQYNFFKNVIGNNEDQFFIKRISPDRTEISISSVDVDNSKIEEIANNIINKFNSSSYFINYLLNFGLNNQILVTNIALEKIETGYEILFKLYEPLGENINEKDNLWVVEEKVSPYVFGLNLNTLIELPSPLMLKGANFNIVVNSEINNISTQYTNYDNLYQSLQISQSNVYSNNTYHKLLNILTSQSIQINVDYTDYSNFIFFGSIKQRVDNFYNKVKQIEEYNDFIINYTGSISSNPSLQIEINRYTASVHDIIANFDGYEHYLYFESSSFSWPKTNSNLPYILWSVSSSNAQDWYDANLKSASLYDESNVNSFKNTIPAFLIDNDENNNYITFINMIGHYFDNIWILLKSITDINLANNNSEEGVSKNIVYYVLKSLGLNLFNSLEGDNLDKYLIGDNTGSYYYTGSLTDFSPTSSYLNNIPKEYFTAEIYKRLYHNLPLLVKNKGTTKGLQNIITTFGITGSVLNVKEYGGELKKDVLKGYSENKIRITDSNPLENVISPLLTIQQNVTSSLDFINDDLQYIDISFSPQNQINLYISESISHKEPNFDLDDYIGDPRQKYLSNYPDLYDKRKFYFEEGYISGIYNYPGFTSSYLDYSGFIRLIQFFDNSLFKTLENFVPLRTNLSTGITFGSPILERNKFVIANPTNSTTESIQTAEINKSEINAEYDPNFRYLGGNKSEYYSGELSGSILDLNNDYFIPSNINPYLYNINVWNAQHNITESVNLDTFNKSDFNVLFNNISSSVLSKNRKTIDQYNIVYDTSSITTPSELQDSYLSLSSYANSRHNGVKLTGLDYNIYSPTDISYGKEPIINKWQTYFLTFTELRESYPELIGKTAVWIDSLIDKTGAIYPVDKTGSYFYYNLISNFGKDSRVHLQVTEFYDLSVYHSTNFQETSVYRPAYLWPKAILTNESGSKYFNNSPSYILAPISISNIYDSLRTLIPLNEPIWNASITGDTTLLTSSIQLGNIGYATSYIQDNTVPNSGGYGGYDIIKDLISINIGDEIRFNQNEDYTYVIKQVSLVSEGPPPLDYYYALILDKKINNSLTSSINAGTMGFLIRRYSDEDPSKLLLNSRKIGNGKGYIAPRYMSPDLNNKFDTIVSQLKENGRL